MTARDVEYAMNELILWFPRGSRAEVILTALQYVIASTGQRGADALDDYCRGVKKCHTYSQSTATSGGR